MNKFNTNDKVIVFNNNNILDGLVIQIQQGAEDGLYKYLVHDTKNDKYDVVDEIDLLFSDTNTIEEDTQEAKCYKCEKTIDVHNSLYKNGTKYICNDCSDKMGSFQETYPIAGERVNILPSGDLEDKALDCIEEYEKLLIKHEKQSIENKDLRDTIDIQNDTIFNMALINAKEDNDIT